jgi:hypothetical protein
MKDGKAPGLKSAYELAMARLDQKQGKTASLSDGQKKALGEIDRQVRARIAEIEILMGQRIAEARAKGEAEELQKLEQQKQSDIARARDRAEADRERVRQGRP